MWKHYYKGAACFKAVLQVTTSAGTFEVRTSSGGDNPWVGIPGPIQSDDPYTGAVTNWTVAKEIGVWSSAANKPSAAWTAVPKATSPPLATRGTQALASPMAKPVQSITARSVKHGPSGSLVFDMGFNMVGVTTLHPDMISVSGAGSITVRQGEFLNPDGSVNNSYSGCGNACQIDTHILTQPTDLPTEGLTPLFVWHGFQYVEITTTGGVSVSATAEGLEGHVIRTSVNQISSLRFGDDSFSNGSALMLNSLHNITLVSQGGNIAQYIPTDCPTREKHGWLGDALTTGEEAMLNFDMVRVLPYLAQDDTRC